VISLDFVEGLPLSDTYNCMLIVVDLLTKCGHPFTAIGLAKAFFHSIYRLHGLPITIVSNHDRIFTNHFWTELFKLTDVKLCHSTTYHPQSDGQTEHLNQCLETYLRCYVHACPLKWSQWLTTTEFRYNTYLHSMIGRTHLRFSMVIHLACWLWTPPRLFIQKCRPGQLLTVGWTSYSSTISTELKIV
jgi:hypothetical protein